VSVRGGESKIDFAKGIAIVGGLMGIATAVSSYTNRGDDKLEHRVEMIERDARDMGERVARIEGAKEQTK
jgi:hypothetical protein